DAGSGESAPSDPADAADTVVMFTDRACGGRGSVRRVVVGKNDFPVAAGKHGLQPLDNLYDIVAFLERRDDNREFWRRLHGFIPCVRLGNTRNNGGMHAHRLTFS